ncbi:EMILIN-3-like [Salvelinus fontinalis]|uniref:EMILIN-3-like n=1 Tax=Salvelinus fontinalis TaxID=8038 RepID=UPI0024857127|nr:EMILIN-3-like [Salvelinus fontinalis]
MHIVVALHPILLLSVTLSLVDAKSYRPHQSNLYKAGPNPHHLVHGKPTSRHKNHCAYVVEKTMSFTMQNGVTPYVKAEYNKCAWGQKCSTLMYRLMYKPVYKVAHKTLTELEWRCCPGYSGSGCMEGPPAYNHPIKAMPPFKGSPFKGPPIKGNPWSQTKGPPPMKSYPMLAKDPPMKGPPPMKSYPMKAKGPHPSKSYPIRHFGPPMTHPSYPVSSFERYPSVPQHHRKPDHHEPGPDHHSDPDHHKPDQHKPEPDHHEEPDHQGPDHHQPESDLEPDHQQQPGLDQPDQPYHTDHSELEPVAEETAPPAGSQEIDGQALDTVGSESAERLDRMEEDMRRLSRGLETLSGTVNGLEDSLRASLREDASRMLSALLSASPGPVPALSSSPHSIVGFADIPGGNPDAEGLDGGLDGGQAFPGLGELTGRVEELRVELQAKAAELEELRGTVIKHDGTLKKMSGGMASLTGTPLRDTQRAMEDLVDVKLGGARTEIIDGFEKRVESAESRCEENAGEVRRQCHREQQERQEQMEQALEGSATGLRKELGHVQAQIQGHDLTEGCCGTVTGLAERVHMLEQSVSVLNQSQEHLRVELGGHKAHVEGMLEGRLGYVEAKLNLTGSGKVKGGRSGSSGSGGVQSSSLEGEMGPGGLEARLEGKLKALEGRLLTAVEELGNATAPALIEGHVVSTLETKLESLRRRLELDVDSVQKQLRGLELLCMSSSQPIHQGVTATLNTHVVEEDKKGGGELKGLLDVQADRLNSVNLTLQSLLTRLSQREDHREGEGSSVQGEIMLLKFNVRSVNRILKGLKESVVSVVRDVGHANTTWQEREERLAQQVKGVVQLVGRQASMLGAGERRLTRLKGELQELRRRLAGEVKGCRSTALGVQKEVVEVGGRLASMEGQCKGFSHLAEDLERIRAELERQSDVYLSQVNSTLTNHAHQLSELRQELRNCTSKAEPTQQSLFLVEPEQLRGDQ